MSEASAEAPAEHEDAEKKKKNMYENKSKEELVILAKKQFVLLHKSKSKTDEMNKKCDDLEQERNKLLRKHHDTENELIARIETLENNLTTLRFNNEELLREKDVFLEKLRASESSNASNTTALHDKKEEMQCLSMQLETVKATCVCFQEELTKQQINNQKMKTEIEVLIQARDTAIEAVKNQTRQFEEKEKTNKDLLVELDEFQKKYAICIEENCLLSSKVETLEGEINKTLEENLIKKETIETKTSKEVDVTDAKSQNAWDLQCSDETDDQISFLIMDNQRLQSEVGKIKKENEELKEKLFSSKDSENSWNLVPPQKIDDQKFLEIEKENSELMNNICEIQSENSLLKRREEDLEEEKKYLLTQTQQLQADKNDLEVRLKALESESQKLKEENNNLSASLQQFSDFQSGYEFALLHGADAEKLNFGSSDGKEVGISKSFEELKEVEKHTFTEQHQTLDPLSLGGLEFSLLGGGEVDQLFTNATLEITNATDTAEHKPTAEDLCEPSKYVNADIEELEMEKEKLSCMYQTAMEEKACLENDIESIKKRLDEYAVLLQQSLNENESLKLKLESTDNEKPVIDVATNTEIERADLKRKPRELEEKLDDSVLELEDKNVSALQSEISSYIEKCNNLVTERDILNCQVADLNKKMEELALCEENLKTHSEFLEKQNVELSEKLEKKCADLDDLNLQLESLVIGVKQGVRHKTTLRAERQLGENLSLLKNLVEDMITKSISNSTKIIGYESEIENLSALKQAMNEKLLQMSELNQFLEYEARELRNEVEQLKSATSPQSSDYGNVFYEGNFSNAELYSIEETNEAEEKPQSADAENSILEDAKESSDAVSAEDTAGKNMLTQTQDKSVEMDYSETKESLNPGCSVDVQSLQSKIAELTAENGNLSLSLKDKSVLVEQIHCQMDSLLEKVETLSSELEEKESDLKNQQNKISFLDNELNNLLSSPNQLKLISFQCIKENIKKLNTYKQDCELDINNFKCDSSELLLKLRVELSKVLEEYENKTNQKLIFSENLCNILSSYFSHLTEDINIWLKALVESPVTVDRLEKIKNDSKSNSLSEIFLESQITHSFPSNIKLFDSKINEFFSALLDYFKSGFSDMLKELNEYKLVIVPNMKETITNLEEKIQGRVSNENAENQKSTVDTLKNVEGDSSVVNMKAQLTEAETKANKLKQFAVKLKKDLADTKKQLNEALQEKESLSSELKKLKSELNISSSGQFNYAKNYQNLQNEFDKVQDDVEFQKDSVKKLQGDLATTLLELNGLKEKYADKESQLQKTMQMHDACLQSQQETGKKFMDSESKLIIQECKYQENISKVHELENLIEENQEKIKILTDENNNMKQQLQQMQKEEKKSNLLDLEIADYERSIFELNNKVQLKEKEISDLNLKFESETEKNSSLLEEIRSSISSRQAESKRADQLKATLEKAKFKLSAANEQVSDLQTSISSLKIQLEILTQQEENCKLQLSETSAEIQHLKEMLKTSSENHQRIVRSLESKISTQKQDILCAHKEVESIKQEFGNYKIRVHSVLKQQKTNVPTFTADDEDTREKLENIIERLKVQIKDVSDKNTALSMEYETLQEEHDNLQQRYNKCLEEKERKDSDWHLRLEQINAEKNKLRATQEELSSQHLLQNEILVSTYKKQMKIMSEEHQRAVCELQRQLECADTEIVRLQRDRQRPLQGQALGHVEGSSPTFDILSQERQEGEGSENTDEPSIPISNLSLTTIPTSGFMPLEKLIQSPLELGSSSSFIQYQDTEKLVSDLNAANKQIEHIREVLNDSESSNLRLSEQVRVLKEEVRRLERNQEREKHSENLEYLKNVFIKFATLSASNEKAMLIPVLTTMLKLSPSEQNQLKSVAGELDPNDNPNTGWGSYLHRWSGLS